MTDVMVLGERQTLELDGVLAGVRSPRDLDGLDRDALVRLAGELREVIIASVLRHGGHLGSNLGVVELTIALHRVLRCPDDVLLWDTGHQAYPHKLLTGRAEGFEALRQAGGLSGYPSRTESDHDWIENSHASTVLAYAHGMAVAVVADGTPERRVVAVIGDGSLTGGMSFEGLNNLGHHDTDVLVILNDNGRSYAPTASRLGASLRDRAGVSIDEPTPTPRSWSADVDPSGFFEALGVRYLGIVDGHDLAALETALADAVTERGPRVLHVITQKGRGYEPALTDDTKRLHDTSTAAAASFTTAFAETMVELGAADPRVVAITAAMPDSTGLVEFSEQFPDRFLDVGIAEQHAFGTAAGMAMGGLVPFVAVYSTFLTRAFDQAVYDIGLHGLPVVFCLDRAGITGDDGASHHGVLDLMLCSKIPGITIFAPSTVAELRVMLREALAIATGPTPGPVAIRWSKTVPPETDADGVGAGTAARRLRTGEDVCLCAVGKTVHAAMEAADVLAATGVSATVWDLRCARPIDPALLADAARHRAVVTIEDGVREGGIGAAIVDQLAAHTARLAHPPRTRVLGTPVAFLAHGKPDAILAELGLGPRGIAESALDALRSSTTTAPTITAGVHR